MGSAEKFCLRWNDFESNISVAFRELRDDKDFFDVTLACDDNQLPAHKVILSACSPFFRNILRKNPHQHPLLYLKGVKYKELQSVLNFMYMGEVNVAQEELNSFLSVAEDLRVKGLTQNNSDRSNSSSSNNTKTEQKHSSHIPAARIREPPEREHIPPAKKHRPAPHHHVSVPDLPPADDDIQEVVPVKSEPRDTLTVPAPSEASYHHDSTEAEGGTVAIQDSYAEDSYNYGGGEGYEDQGGYDDGAYEQTLQTVNADGNKGPMDGYNSESDALVRAKIQKLDTGWQCTDCSFYGTINEVYKHIEKLHVQVSFSCNLCGKECASRNGLLVHRSRFHRKTKATDFGY